VTGDWHEIGKELTGTAEKQVLLCNSLPSWSIETGIGGGVFAAVGYGPAALSVPTWSFGEVEGLSERQWEGARLRIGEVVNGMDDLRARCIMTPSTLIGDQAWGCCVCAKGVRRRTRTQQYVITSGRVAVGDRSN